MLRSSVNSITQGYVEEIYVCGQIKHFFVVAEQNMFTGCDLWLLYI